jgi:hypothetical protein
MRWGYLLLPFGAVRPPSGRIVKDNPDRVSPSRLHTTHTMSHVDAIGAPHAPDRAMVDGEDHALSLTERDDLGPRLHARPLLEIFAEDSRLVITSLGRHPIRKTPLLAFKSTKRMASRRKLPFHENRPFFVSPGARPATTEPDPQGHGSARKRTAWQDPESTTETIQRDSSEVRRRASDSRGRFT